MAFKIFTEKQAKDFGMRIINAYKKSHNLPILGTGVVLPTSTERTQNKNRQSTYRGTHKRVMAWENEDNREFLEPVKLKLLAIGKARKELNRVNAQIKAIQTKIDYGVLTGGDVADKIAQMQVLQAQKVIKENNLQIAIKPL